MLSLINRIQFDPEAVVFHKNVVTFRSVSKNIRRETVMSEKKNFPIFEMPIKAKKQKKSDVELFAKPVAEINVHPDPPDPASLSGSSAGHSNEMSE